VGLGPPITVFDYGAGLLLIVSGLVGLARGATREITTVAAFVIAAVLAVFALRLTGPVARHLIHAVWLANIAAILFVFILAYVVLRLVSGLVTRGVRETSLSGVDRLLGLGIGLVRAVVVLGGFVLLLDAATPPERMPRWIVQARLYPLAAAAGGALRAFAPEGLKVAREVAPALADAVAGEDGPVASRRRRREARDPADQDQPIDASQETQR
jgi:membrane protein required for colicin V production